MSNFTIFKKRYSLWSKCLHGPKETHSVFNQTSTMIWNGAVWRLIKECRSLAPKVPESPGSIQQNGMIHEFIDYLFFRDQLSAIRRLTDSYPIEQNSSGSKKDKSVYSIIALLDDIKRHSDFATRKNLFRVEGLEYNLDKAHKLFYKTMRFGVAGAYPIKKSPEIIKMRHAQIDSLTNTSPQTRTPNDTIRIDLLDKLREKVLRSSKKINRYVDKFIAHAATPRSRKSTIVLVEEIWNAQKIILQTTNFLSANLFSISRIASVPIPQSNNFAYINEPLISQENLGKLSEIWKKFEDESKLWNDWNTKKFLKGLKFKPFNWQR